MAALTWMGVPGTAKAWTACGFDVTGGRFVLDGVAFDVDTPASWGFDHIAGDTSRLGVPTTAERVPVTSRGVHPNAVDGIDHVVYAVPNLDEAAVAVESVLGLELRRRFHPRGSEGPEMAFYRAGPTVIEVVAGPPKAGLWGVAFRCPDLDATVAAMRESGAPVGDPNPAVQGGRIASVWKGHVGWGVAVMSSS